MFDVVDSAIHGAGIAYREWGEKKKKCETGLGKDWGHVLEGENLFWS